MAVEPNLEKFLNDVIQLVDEGTTWCVAPEVTLGALRERIRNGARRAGSNGNFRRCPKEFQDDILKMVNAWAQPRGSE